MPHHHTASSHAKQSPSLAVTDNDGEPVGDRWDDDEDWGSLEVGFVPYLKVNRFTKTQNFQSSSCYRNQGRIAPNQMT